MSQIHYRHLRHYKYRLREHYSVDIDIHPEAEVRISDYVVLTPEGKLSIRERYSWDGPSGPTIDTRNFMRGSLVHDALYQLIREGHLDEAVYRRKADDILKEHCLEDGMSDFRAWYVHKAVYWLGKPAVKEREKFTKELSAPKKSIEKKGS